VITVEALNLLVKYDSNRAIHIDENDMIHLTWRHVTVRLNMTGLLYLSRFLDGDASRSWRITGFDLTGTPDDGYQLWIHDIGLRLDEVALRHFKDLLRDSLDALARLGKEPDAVHLPDALKLTTVAPIAWVASPN
jgi:hypothetical protein